MFQDLGRLVPPNKTGHGLTLEHERAHATCAEASGTLRRACLRVLDPAIWQDLSGPSSAGFRQFGPNGHKADRFLQTGDLIRANVPGPGTFSDEGFDWVKVEAIIDGSDPGAEKENFGMMVRPCPDPLLALAETAHFFAPVATCTFIIERHGNKVTARYHGRNEEANPEAGNLVEKLRNTVTAWAAIAGFEKIQWGPFLEGLLRNDIGPSK